MSNYEAQLQGFLFALMDVENEKAKLQDQAKEILEDAKAEGYSPKILRKLIARRKRARDEVAEEDRLIEDYENRVGW